MAEDPKQAWSAVGDQATGLARLLSERLKGGGVSGSNEHADADASAVRDALDRLTAAVGDVADRATAAVRDPEVRAQFGDLASTLNIAIGATVDRVGAAVDEKVGRGRKRKDGETG